MLDRQLQQFDESDEKCNKQQKLMHKIYIETQQK